MRGKVHFALDLCDIVPPSLILSSCGVPRATERATLWPETLQSSEVFSPWLEIVLLHLVFDAALGVVIQGWYIVSIRSNILGSDNHTLQALSHCWGLLDWGHSFHVLPREWMRIVKSQKWGGGRCCFKITTNFWRTPGLCIEVGCIFTDKQKVRGGSRLCHPLKFTPLLFSPGRHYSLAPLSLTEGSKSA